jgi:hypothetical protein
MQDSIRQISRTAWPVDAVKFNSFSIPPQCFATVTPIGYEVGTINANQRKYMNAIEHCTEPDQMKSSRPALEIRFQFVDGSKETFIQPDAEVAEAIRQRANLSSLFNQSRIVVADDYSKSVFVCALINRVDLVFNGLEFSKIPSDYVDLVELTEAEFRQCVPMNDPALLQNREHRRQVGDLMVSFLDLRMTGGNHVYLMREAVVKLPAESQSFMQRLLSRGTYGIRLREGGHGLLNLQNLIGYTVYPGVPELPADTWMAQPHPTYETLH